MKNREIDKLLKGYFSNFEEVPETLNFKIKNKLKEGNYLKKNILQVATKCAAIVVVCFFGSIFILTNANAEIYNSMSEIPIIGSIAKVFVFRTYKDTSENFTANVDIPEIENLGKAGEILNKEVQEYVGGIIKTYEEEKGIGNGEGKLALTTGYDVMANNDRYFSLKVWTNEVRAGANAYNEYYNVDKEANKIIKLKDLFDSTFDYKTEIYKEIRNQMNEVDSKSENLVYFDGDMGLKEINENQKFYITDEDELVISFDKYEVAPGFMGVQNFVVGKISNGKLEK